MNTTVVSSERATRTVSVARNDMKLESVVVPVSDVDRAKRFYLSLGWRLDADFANGDSWRIVQVTPTGSACSFFFGTGLTSAKPGAAPGLLLMVEDIDAARAELIDYGVDVGAVFHFEHGLHFLGAQGRVPGPDPQRRSYSTFASFDDPDGNGWLLQEIKERLPGRAVASLDIATLVPLLKEAEERHTVYQATAPKHPWQEWYAPYLIARQRGKSPEEAVSDATRHVQREYR